MTMPKDGSFLSRPSTLQEQLTTIWRILRAHLSETIRYSVLLLLEAMVALIPALLTKELVDQYSSPVKQGAGDAGVILAGLLLLAFLGTHLLRLLLTWTSATLSQGVSQDLRCRMMEAITNAPFQVSRDLDTGDLITRVNQDSASLESGLVHFLQLLTTSLLRLITVPLVLIALDWRLLLVLLPPVPMILLSTRYGWRRISEASEKAWEARGERLGLASQAITRAREIHLLGLRQFFLDRFRSVDFNYGEARIRTSWLFGLKHGMMGSANALGLALVWAAGGIWVLQDTLSLGDVVAATTFAGLLYMPVEGLGRIGEWWNEFSSLLGRVQQVLALPKRLSGDKKPSRDSPPSLEVRNIGIDLPSGRALFEKVSFVVEPGERVGLWGPNGSGKTTLLLAIAQLVEPSRGEVLLDGVPVTQYDPDSLPELVGFVPTDPQFFPGTVRWNITGPEGGGDNSKLNWACEAAGVSTLVSGWPLGLDHPVSESETLSSGEKRRVALARALYRDARLLLLDEPTANLDREEVTRLLSVLDQIGRGRTVVLTSHEERVLGQCDRTFLLGAGLGGPSHGWTGSSRMTGRRA